MQKSLLCSPTSSYDTGHLSKGPQAAFQRVFSPSSPLGDSLGPAGPRPPGGAPSQARPSLLLPQACKCSMQRGPPGTRGEAGASFWVHVPALRSRGRAERRLGGRGQSTRGQPPIHSTTANGCQREAAGDP